MVKPKQIHRRKFLKWSVPFVAGLPFAQTLIGCSDKAKTNATNTTDSTATKKKTTRNNSEKQKSNTAEFLYYNEKTKVLHYPGLREKDKLITEKFRQIKISDWDTWQQMLDSGEARLSKEKSGLAFEKLALKNFQLNPTDENLQRTMSIAVRAFGKDYAQHNRCNWRAHDLVVQLISLNNSIVAGDKWNYFSNALSNVSMSKVKVPKRMIWIQSKDLFDKKVAYINNHKTDYMTRLKSRLI